jgi:hypothetical protein
MRLKKIHLLVGQSQYNIFRDWSEALQQGFTRRGVEAILIDPAADADSGAGDEVVSLGFNMVRSWCEKTMHRPHLLWSVDHPVFNTDFFLRYYSGMNFAPGTVPILVDRSRCYFAEQVFNYPRTEFLPHAATSPVCESTRDERPIDALFFGSFEMEPECRRRVMDATKKMAPGLITLFEQLLDTYHYSAGLPMDLQCWKLLVEQVKIPEKQAMHLYCAVYPWIDYYFRMQHRASFIRSITKAKLHIYGNGPWDQIGLADNITVHSAVPHSQIPDLLRQSKVLLNHAPTLRDGGHERVFDGLMNGCAIVTTPSVFLQEEFGAEAGIGFCPAGEEGSLLDELILSPAGGMEKGRELVMRAHTMDVRAGQLLNYIEQRWGLTSGDAACAE